MKDPLCERRGQQGVLQGRPAAWVCSISSSCLTAAKWCGNSHNAQTEVFKQEDGDCAIHRLLTVCAPDTGASGICRWLTAFLGWLFVITCQKVFTDQLSHQLPADKPQAHVFVSRGWEMIRACLDSSMTHIWSQNPKDDDSVEVEGSAWGFAASGWGSCCCHHV